MVENSSHFDVIVVGGGPAGLSAGIICAYKGLRTAVFEGGTWGGLMSTIYPYKHITNYPGVPKILASHLVSEWVRQTVEQGAYLIPERVLKVTPDRVVITEEAEYSAQVIILATGMKPNTLGIPGERKFSTQNRGVYPYVTEPALFRDKRVLIVGGGDTALDAVIDASAVTDSIWLVHRRSAFRGAESTLQRIRNDNLAQIILNTELIEIGGESEVSWVVLENKETGKREKLETDTVVLAVGLVPNTEIFSELGLKMNGKFVNVDSQMRTNIEGVFAAGDVVSVYQLATIAAAQGALAAHNAYKYIRKPYWA